MQLKSHDGYSSRPSDLLQQEIHLTEIKVYQLSNNNIWESDKKAIISLIKSLRFHNVASMFVPVVILCASNWLVIGTYKDSTNIIAGIIMHTILNIIYILCIVSNIKNLIHIKDINSVQKAQYGTVMNKYYVSHTDSDRDTDYTYYVNILFKDKGSYIKNITCEKDIYELLSLDEQVLVISFDNKRAYCIPKNYHLRQ